MTEWAPEDLDDLRQARRRLESPGIAMRMSDLLGRPIEGLAALLPDAGRERVDRAVRRAMERALRVAISTTHNSPLRSSSDGLHKLAGATSGAVGGFFGLPGLLLELPATTVIIFRSIADIARSEGSDLRDPATRIGCLEVFAFGGRTAADDAAETGYFAVRAAMASAVNEAVQHVAARGMAARGAPGLVRLVDKLATRFGIVVQQKVALELFPLVGAASGAAINTLFMGHFQNVAHGHFTVRRLESYYGEAAVRRRYREP